MTELKILYENNPHEISISGTDKDVGVLFVELFNSKLANTTVQRVVVGNGDIIMLSPSKILHMSLCTHP
jgi:hypothetical protein